MEKPQIRPRHAKTPERMTTKIDMGDYVPDIYRNKKFHYDAMSEFWPPHMRICQPNIHSVTFLGIF